MGYRNFACSLEYLLKYTDTPNRNHNRNQFVLEQLEAFSAELEKEYLQDYRRSGLKLPEFKTLSKNPRETACAFK